jgi:hypothetical protein
MASRHRGRMELSSDSSSPVTSPGEVQRPMWGASATLRSSDRTVSGSVAQVGRAQASGRRQSGSCSVGVGIHGPYLFG